jgi:hypothetical protein
VRPEGFVMRYADGTAVHSEGLPWFIQDMKPQGFLGRAFAHQYAATLGLPPNVAHWNETQALRALLSHDADAIGNLLLGDIARDHFVSASAPRQVQPQDYPAVAAQALTVGETWSSAGGEQPKFCAYTTRGHAIVKFTTPEDNPISQRWRDLLLAEHLALAVLQSHGIAAADSQIWDVGSQRFLEVIRFDRAGLHGRHALHSLAALDNAFVGNASAPWPVIAAELARQRVVLPEAAEAAALLYAFGALIGNTDMHSGNLSFVGDSGTPFALSPAYDMLPMGFRPTAGGALANSLPDLYMHPSVPHATWHRALALAQDYAGRIAQETRFSAGFLPCARALQIRLERSVQFVARLG